MTVVEVDVSGLLLSRKNDVPQVVPLVLDGLSPAEILLELLSLLPCDTLKRRSISNVADLGASDVLAPILFRVKNIETALTVKFWE